jgi:micrococcal nuclease
VVNVTRARPGVFLDFGEDWRNDFAVAIANRDLRTFVEAGLDPERLGGATVRIRGWIDRRRGPVIDVSHPEQIEVIER